MDWSLAGTFSDVIEQAAVTFSDKTAFKDQYRDLGFNAYRDEVDQLASALFDKNLLPGSRIAILSQNRIEVAVLLGLCRAGFVPVPLNWRLPVEDISTLLVDCEPSVLFVEHRYLSCVGEMTGLPKDCLVVCIGDKAPGVDSYANLVARGSGNFQIEVRPDSPACIIYTSGTTGTPKGAVLTHAGVVGNCRDVAEEAIGFTSDDVTLMVMPLFHVGGIWYYMFPSFSSGCTTYVRERFDPEDVITTCERERITNIHIVPTMLADLLSRPAFIRAARHLRLVVYAGSSMPSDLLRKAMNSMSQCSFAQAYGSTEAGSITSLGVAAHQHAMTDASHASLLRSCGKPFSNTQIRIEKDDPNSDDPVGEILVRSPKLMAGYWRRPDATAERLENGWFRTGDLGYIDAEGYCYIVDRKNDMVISGGENIYPFEVEEVLCSHPEVQEASVFGVPDPRWVERLEAAIVLVPGSDLTSQGLIEYARLHLPGYKTPKVIHTVLNLPKSPVGKVLRKHLRESFSRA